MNDRTVRNATHQDIEAMLPLLEQLFSIEADFNFNREVQARGLALMLDGCGKHRTVKVACKAGKIIGMCMAQTRISTAQGRVSAVVEDLVVDADLRGKGVGQMLLGAIQDWARDKDIAVLSLLADKNNQSGLAFYANRSWQKTDLVCLTKSVEP